MSIARINMVEYQNEKDLDRLNEKYIEEGPKIFSEAEMLFTIQTGPTSVMRISVYPSEKIAKKSLSARDKWIKNYVKKTKVKEVWFLEVKMKQSFVRKVT